MSFRNVLPPPDNTKNKEHLWFSMRGIYIWQQKVQKNLSIEFFMWPNVFYFSLSCSIHIKAHKNPEDIEIIIKYFFKYQYQLKIVIQLINQ